MLAIRELTGPHSHSLGKDCVSWTDVWGLVLCMMDSPSLQMTRHSRQTIRSCQTCSKPCWAVGSTQPSARACKNSTRPKESIVMPPECCYTQTGSREEKQSIILLYDYWINNKHSPGLMWDYFWPADGNVTGDNIPVLHYHKILYLLTLNMSFYALQTTHKVANVLI